VELSKSVGFDERKTKHKEEEFALSALVFRAWETSFRIVLQT